MLDRLAWCLVSVSTLTRWYSRGHCTINSQTNFKSSHPKYSNNVEKYFLHECMFTTMQVWEYAMEAPKLLQSIDI
jgi:hypothetical protein